MSRMIDLTGRIFERMTLTQWAEKTGINRRTIAARLDSGRPPEDALSTDPWGQEG